MQYDIAIINRRRFMGKIMVRLCIAGTALALFILAAILVELLVRGIGALSITLFTEPTPPPGSQGGLYNAIIGSLEMTIAAMIVATPVGILAGTCLAEYGRENKKLATTVRFINDTLLSAPSIIIGLFAYSIVVVPMGHFSGYAGAVALALIAMPVIVRTTEDMLELVPDQTREAAIALGMPRWQMIMRITWKSAAKGILTGILLAVARISGETAPLLFTALNNQFTTYDMNHPMPSLPVAIFQFAMSPYKDWQNLAWGGALLISASVLILSIVARTMAGRKTQ